MESLVNFPSNQINKSRARTNSQLTAPECFVLFFRKTKVVQRSTTIYKAVSVLDGLHGEQSEKCNCIFPGDLAVNKTLTSRRNTFVIIAPRKHSPFVLQNAEPSS